MVETKTAEKVGKEAKFSLYALVKLIAINAGLNEAQRLLVRAGYREDEALKILEAANE